MEPHLLSAHDVAIRLGLSVDTVTQLARQDTLPAQIVDGAFWFHQDDVRAFANRFPDPDPPGDGKMNDLIRSPAEEVEVTTPTHTSYEGLLQLARELDITSIVGALGPPLNGRMWIGEHALEDLLLPDGQARHVILAIAPGGPPQSHRALRQGVLDAEGRARLEQAVYAAGGYVYEGRLAVLTPEHWLEQHPDHAADASRQEQLVTGSANWTRDMQGAKKRSDFSSILPAAVAAGWPRDAGDQPMLFLDDRQLFHLLQKGNIGRNVLIIVGEIASEHA